MINIEKTKNCLVFFVEEVEQNFSLLNDLDNAIGDGDHGTNLERGMTDFKSKLNQKEYQSPEEIFKDLGMSCLSKIGGASGPLYGSCFLAIAKKANEKEIVELLEIGLDQIKKIGKSDIGEKTMIDLWQPAIECIKENNLTSEKIDQFVNETKKIKATKGRASYLNERSLDHIDPGAFSSGLFFKSLLKAGLI